MDIYTVFGLSQPPKQLRSIGANHEFYCYFTPPLPDVIVVFCTQWPESAPQRMSIQLHLDSEDKNVCKDVGTICKETAASCYVGNWNKDEQIISDEIQEKGRLIKMVVCQDNLMDLDLDSQDSGITETTNPRELSAFEVHNDITNESDKENSFSDAKKSHKSSSQLMESRQTPHRTSSIKRKSIFDFDDEDKHIASKQAKTNRPSNQHKEGKLKQYLTETPKSKKNESVGASPFLSSQRKTPRSKKLNSSIAKSPNTPGFFDLKVPSPRWGHSFCKIDQDNALIIGGQGVRSQISKDSIWQYEFSTKTFVRIEDESNGASRRMGHTAIYDEKSALVYVFGGSKNKKWYSDIHTFDTRTKKWVTLQTTGKAPARAYHSCTLLHDELLIFGGVFPNPDPIPDGCSSDVHFFNTESNSWYQPIVNGECPRARSGHSACLVDGLLYIFGGWDAPTCFNDLWTLDTGLMSFKKLEVSGEAPSARSWHGTTLTSNQQNIVVYGGYNGDMALSDIHVFKIPSKTWSHIGDCNHLAITGHKLLTFKTARQTDKKEEITIVFGGGNNEGKFYNNVKEIHPALL